MGWFGPRGNDCTCCGHASPCYACATDGQPTETYRVVIPSSDYGAGTYTLAGRHYNGYDCSWSVDGAIACGDNQAERLALLFRNYGGQFQIFVYWVILFGGMFDFRPSTYYGTISGLPDCDDFSSLAVAAQDMGFPCGTPTGPALVTAL